VKNRFFKTCSVMNCQLSIVTLREFNFLNGYHSKIPNVHDKVVFAKGERRKLRQGGFTVVCWNFGETSTRFQKFCLQFFVPCVFLLIISYKYVM
jgi:hypothetical protein